MNELEELIIKINNEYKKLIRPIDAATLKLDELIALEQKLNKTMGDIELQITMNSIMEQRMKSEFEAIKNRRTEESKESLITNVARIKNLAKQGRTKANLQNQEVDDINKRLDTCNIDSNKIFNQLNEILLRPPLMMDQFEINSEYELIHQTTLKLIDESDRIKINLEKSLVDFNNATKQIINYKPNEENYSKHVKSTTENHEDISKKVRKNIFVIWKTKADY